jgi:hypothetical protein
MQISATCHAGFERPAKKMSHRPLDGRFQVVTLKNISARWIRSMYDGPRLFSSPGVTAIRF